MTPAPISVERLSPAISDYPGNHFEDAEPIMVATLDGEYVRHSDYAALLQQLAEHEKEADRLHALINAGNRRIAELEAAYLHYRPLAERAEAAERAREEACANAARYLAFRGSDDGVGAADVGSNTIYRRGVWLDDELDAFLAANK